MTLPASFPEFLAKKAYEASYAVFRISGRMDKESGLRSALEMNATRLLEFGIREDIVSAGKSVKVLEYLLRLGGDTGVLHSSHVNLIINELANLESAMAENDFNVKAILQSEIQSATHPATHPATAIEDYIPGYGDRESEIIIESDSTSEEVRARQETILQFVLQFGNCRFRDIFEGLQDKLQDVGERTVRYDLQDLIEQGKIEKFGPGGTHTFYRAKRVEAKA